MSSRPHSRPWLLTRRSGYGSRPTSRLVSDSRRAIISSAVVPAPWEAPSENHYNLWVFGVRPFDIQAPLQVYDGDRITWTDHGPEINGPVTGPGNAFTVGHVQRCLDVERLGSKNPKIIMTFGGNSLPVVCRHDCRRTFSDGRRPPPRVRGESWQPLRRLSEAGSSDASSPCAAWQEEEEDDDDDDDDENIMISYTHSLREAWISQLNGHIIQCLLITKTFHHGAVVAAANCSIDRAPIINRYNRPQGAYIMK